MSLYNFFDRPPLLFFSTASIVIKMWNINIKVTMHVDVPSVRTMARTSDYFNIGVGGHLWSLFRPLPFITATDEARNEQNVRKLFLRAALC